MNAETIVLVRADEPRRDAGLSGAEQVLLFARRQASLAAHRQSARAVTKEVVSGSHHDVAQSRTPKPSRLPEAVAVRDTYRRVRLEESDE